VSLKLRDWDIVGRLVGERVKGLGGRLVTWGHLGDRNVRFNIVRDKDGGDMTNVLEPWIYEEVVKRGGSVSAEHGIGQCKGDLMERLILGDKGMDLMRGVKKVKIAAPCPSPLPFPSLTPSPPCRCLTLTG